MKQYTIEARCCGIDHKAKFACEPDGLRELMAMFHLVHCGIAVNVIEGDNETPERKMGREFI